VESLASLIDAARPGPLESDVFGTTDAVVVEEVLSSLAVAATGVEVRAGLWFRSSVTAVAGVVLDDGREIVVRAYQQSASTVFIDGVVRVQSHLASAGFPCATPLGAPVVVDGVHGRAESMISDPGSRRFDSWEMALSADGLARLVGLAAGLDPAGLEVHPMGLPDDELYPTPHSPLFDFPATAAGADWIDEIAAAARVAITDREAVVAHGDWSARNIRLGPAGLVCAYDWESLQYGPESKALGVAAATWRSLGEPNVPLAPSAPEIQRYIDLYERARRRPLSENQRRSACAAAVFALAYTARCEHALHPGTREGRASGRLARDNGLLSLIP
jgi:hypothetical protein